MVHFRDRVIEQLRRQFPGTWQFDRTAGNQWRSETMTVTAYSVSAARYDGDDNTFATQFLDQDGNVVILVPQSWRHYSM